ncbi:MAG TPA: hypothetical protein VME46_19740, partial [Acidimicrobiales bacterium]|nr:hypothetical protein [Acidimicrobiales bacterium]
QYGAPTGRASVPPMGDDLGWPAPDGPSLGGPPPKGTPGIGAGFGAAPGRNAGTGGETRRTAGMWPGEDPDWLQDTRPAAATLPPDLFPGGKAK